VLGFTLDEREVWFVDGAFRPRGYKVVKYREYGGVELEHDSIISVVEGFTAQYLRGVHQ